MGRPLLPAVATIQVKPSSPSPVTALDESHSLHSSLDHSIARRRLLRDDEPDEPDEPDELDEPDKPSTAPRKANAADSGPQQLHHPISKCKVAVDNTRCIRCHCPLLVPPGPLAPSAPSVDDHLCFRRRRHPQLPNIASHATHPDTPPTIASASARQASIALDPVSGQAPGLCWGFPTPSLPPTT